MNDRQKFDSWPALNWQAWQETGQTLHMFMQIVGKTRLALVPLQNHWWNVPLYVTARGLSTSGMTFLNGEVFDIEFDFVLHQVALRHCSGKTVVIPLRSQAVCEFFTLYENALEELGIQTKIWKTPCELPDPIPFDKDTRHCTYDADAAHRFWVTLAKSDFLFRNFSTSFLGKISPVHFFWGSMDLAVTRFNGKRAPARPNADSIQSEAYSHECISAGFWPGNGKYGQAAFYSYISPVPHDLSEVNIPGPGTFNKGMNEFILNYEDVRTSTHPEETVIEFLESTYSAQADLAHWDRQNLDRLRIS